MWSFMMVVMCYFFQASLVDSVSGLPTHLSVGSKQNPGNSCNDIKTRGGTATKNYYIKLNEQTVKVHCDQSTDGGGWTLVYSFTSTEDNKSVTPRPSWPLYGESILSTTIPQNESDFNAMDFKFWRDLGSDFMMKSDVNNWIVCTDGTGSLVHWRSGSLKCRIINRITSKCPDVEPNAIEVHLYNSGPDIYDDRIDSKNTLAYYYLDTWKTGSELPLFPPCGLDDINRKVIKLTRGSVYIR